LSLFSNRGKAGGEELRLWSSIIQGMPANQPSFHRLAALLKSYLAQVGVTPSEVDRCLAWEDGTLNQRLTIAEDLRVKDLLEILRIAGIEERSFFASLYDLEPRCRSMSTAGEIPYSIGPLSEEDATAFPPFEEVLSLFQELVLDGTKTEEDIKRSAEPSFFGEADLLDRSISED
jgi:hypothetical protein